MPRHALFVPVLVVALVAAAASHGRAAADGFALICNARSPAASVSRAEARALYTGKTKTLGGSAIVVVVRGEDDAPFVQFVDQIFGIPVKPLLAKIKQEVFKGEMAKPLKAATDEDVIQLVGASPGTIGVVSSAGAGHLPRTVTVIAIGG